MEKGRKKGSWLRDIPDEELEDLLRTGSLTGVSLVASKTILYLASAREKWPLDENKRLFLAHEGQGWTAVDNTTGDFFTEWFSTWEASIAWLRDPTLDPEVAESRYSCGRMAAA